MSRGQTPRTRANFPRMKDRGAGRRIRAQRAARNPWAELNAAARAAADAIRAIGAAFQQVGAAVRAAADAVRRNLPSIYRPIPDGGTWVLRALPATPSPWAAPIGATP